MRDVYLCIITNEIWLINRTALASFGFYGETWNDLTFWNREEIEREMVYIGDF